MITVIRETRVRIYHIKKNWCQIPFTQSLYVAVIPKSVGDISREMKACKISLKNISRTPPLLYSIYFRPMATQNISDPTFRELIFWTRDFLTERSVVEQDSNKVYSTVSEYHFNPVKT